MSEEDPLNIESKNPTVAWATLKAIRSYCHSREEVNLTIQPWDIMAIIDGVLEYETK